MSKKVRTPKVPAKLKLAMGALIADFTDQALERSQHMTDYEFDRTVKESHEIIDRRVSTGSFTAKHR